MSQNGKGDSQLKKSVSWESWDKNWEKIFGNKEKNSRPTVDKPIKHDRIEESKRDH